MPIAKDKLEEMLQQGFPDANIEVIALANDNDHYEVRIASARFKDLSMVAQHKLVYQVLGHCVGTTLHALALKTSIK
jgi:stress-induced morphogen